MFKKNRHIYLYYYITIVYAVYNDVEINRVISLNYVKDLIEKNVGDQLQVFKV